MKEFFFNIRFFDDAVGLLNIKLHFRMFKCIIKFTLYFTV